MKKNSFDIQNLTGHIPAKQAKKKPVPVAPTKTVGGHVVPINGVFGGFDKNGKPIVHYLK